MPTESRRNPRTNLALQFGLLLFTAGLLFFAGLGRLPLLEPDEGRNAEVAREMLTAGDWITPHYNSFAYLDKPVVYFWMVAASLRTFGVSEFAARFPSAFVGVLTMLLAWFLARRMFGESVGLRAGIIFASCPLAIVLAREVIFDMTLTFLVTLALAAFWFAEDSDFQKPWLDILMFAAMGVAIITKGPVGILLPLLSILIYTAASGRWRSWKRLRWGVGGMVFFAVALPWFLAVSARNPDFPHYALWEESLKRFATGKAHRGGGIFYYIPVYLGGFFPWSFFLLLAGWNRLRRWRELRQEEARSRLFLLSWAVCVFVFFTLSHSKLPAYFLPAVVPLGILMGLVWEDVGKDATARPPDWLTAAFAALLGVGILVAGASHSWLFATAHVRLAKKLNPSVLAFLQPSLLYTGLILAALGIIGRNIAARIRGRALEILTFTLTAAIVPMLVVRWLAPLEAYLKNDSCRRLAATILSSPARDAPIFGYYYFRTSLPFYLQRPVGLVSVEWGEMTSNYQVAHQAAARRAGMNDPGQGLLIDITEFHRLTKSPPESVLVIVANSQIRALAQNVEHLEPMWDNWDMSIWNVPVVARSDPTRPLSHVVGPFQP